MSAKGTALALSAPYRRALLVAGIGLALYAAYTFWPASSGGSLIASATKQEVETAELRLARLRNIAATAPAREEIYKKVAADLAAREKGLLRGDTAPQAQAQLFTILRRVGSEEDIEVRQSQMIGITELGAYGLSQVTVQFECKIEQLVNYLAALAAQPELIVTRDIQIDAADPRRKTVRVRLNAGVIVPHELLPQKGAEK